MNLYDWFKLNGSLDGIWVVMGIECESTFHFNEFSRLKIFHTRKAAREAAKLLGITQLNIRILNAETEIVPMYSYNDGYSEGDQSEEGIEVIFELKCNTVESNGWFFTEKKAYRYDLETEIGILSEIDEEIDDEIAKFKKALLRDLADLKETCEELIMSKHDTRVRIKKLQEKLK